MKNNCVTNDILIGTGVGLIFGVASHRWYGGLIVGVCYFIGATFMKRKKNK